MKICKADGCSRKYHARGYCSTHYAHYVRPITPEYVSWAGAKQRCYYKGHNRYSIYGGAGIKMCDRWKDSFELFLQDMGTKPTPKHSLERLDRLKGYEPSNCVWANNFEQASNKSTNVYVQVDGVEMTIAQCSRAYNLSPSLLGQRIKAGKVGDELIARPKKYGICIRGHSISGSNLYLSPRGQRQCRACNIMRKKKRYAKTE